MADLKYNVGDIVYILAWRSDSGCVCPPPEASDAPSCPIVECRVDQTSCGGVEGVYSLVWGDNGEPVGLPFAERSLWDSEDELRSRVEQCQVPI